MSPQVSRAVFALSLALLLSFTTIILGSQPEASVGDVERVRDVSRDVVDIPVAYIPAPQTLDDTPEPTKDVPADNHQPTPSPTGVSSTPEPEAVQEDQPPTVLDVPRRSARLADLPQSRQEHIPANLRIDALGLSLNIAPVGVVPGTNQMQIPESPTTIGWYRHGPQPGDPGSAVIAGHVDLRSGARGPFFTLPNLPMEARVVVDYQDGTQQAFEVIAREIYPRDQLPVDIVFANSGDPILTLITCQGPFDYVNYTYENNIVVYAVPVD